MSADRHTLIPVALACGLFASGSAQAGDDSVEEEAELPDMEFLEYLGSWEESDEDWLILSESGQTEEQSADRNEELNDSQSLGKESAEFENEG